MKLHNPFKIDYGSNSTSITLIISVVIICVITTAFVLTALIHNGVNIFAAMAIVAVCRIMYYVFMGE